MLRVSDEQIAQYLGLTELQVGARRRDVAEDPQPEVLAWWAVSIKPCFDPPWVVGAVHEELWRDGPDPEWVVARGFLADAEGAAVAPLQVDAMLDGFADLNPFRLEPTQRKRFVNADIWFETATLDGLGYSVRWGTKAIRDGGFSFSNPQVAWLVRFERVLFSFTQQLVSASGAVRFEKHLGCWAAYRELPQGAEPRE